jgi:hypothetical protein
MEWISGVLEFVNGPAFAGVVTGLFLVSEALSMIPAIKANGIFQAIYNGLAALKAKAALKA